MKAIDTIRKALQIANDSTLKLIEDMSDAPLIQPTPRGGNHPLWVVGHIAFVEGNLPHIIFGEPNPVAHWAPLFKPGTEPTTDASKYPSLQEILRTYRDLRARNLQILDQIGDEGLDGKPKSAPPDLAPLFDTVGSVFLVTAMHQMNHRGQLCDARRAAGRKPLFTPNLG
jgi:hypothetical protein